MQKPITFAFAIALVLAVWVAAESKEVHKGVQLQTTFDFNTYAACGPSSKSNCIVAIQFYDAVSHQLLATTATAPNMTGRQVIVARAQATWPPRQIYAATVYLDNSGQSKEGPRGETSEKASRKALTPEAVGQTQ